MRILLGALALLAGSTVVFGDDKHPRVKMETSLGDIVIELDGEKAPISTENFLKYAKSGFYEGTVFHRIIPTFMIQGGGLDAEMNEKKDGLFPPIKNEWQNGLKNVRGTIAMARRGPDTATSQFFINVVDNPALDAARDGAAYAVFGKVVEGMDVVDKIKSVKCQIHPKYPDPTPVVPVEPVVIKKVTLLTGAAPGAAEKPADKVEEKTRDE